MKEKTCHFFYSCFNMASAGGGGNFNLNPIQSTTVEGKLDVFKITFTTKIEF
jgi:hypothetical protein